MIPDADAKQNDALLQAKLRAGRLSLAFAAVFGRPDKRTAEQTMVLDHLGECASDGANSYNFNQAKDGISLIASGIHRDGAKSILRVIERQISLSGINGVPEKVAPKSKRK